MKVISALCLFLFSLVVTSAAPLPYSGKVAINGANFQGNAQFTFALRDANGSVHWRNADADSSINVPVIKGNYTVLLGGQGMNPLPGRLFLDHPELYLEVHFYRADIQEWLHMLPNQRITSAPHALAAEVANLANIAKSVEAGSITKSMLAAEVRADLNQTVDNASIASNANIAFSKLAINKSDIIGLGIPSADTDTNLSEATVDSMVANNGFLTAGSITRQMLPGDVLADLNATISRSRLAADVLEDLDKSIAPGSITRDMLASDVRTDLNASLSSASVTAANIHPDLVKYFLPEILNHPVGVSILQGTGTTLSSTATGKFLTYQWQKNGVDLSGETNATLVLTDVNAAHDGNYTVIVSNDWGSVTSNVSTFTVVTNSPVITLGGASSLTHEAATSYVDSGATAVDALDGNLTASIVMTGHDFNNTVTGDHNITFNVFDSGGNAAVEKVRTVTVVDTTAPVITLVGDANVSHDLNTPWNDPGVTAYDTRDGNLSIDVSVSGTVDVNSTGANILTYNVSDAVGNAATSVTRTVNIIPAGPWNFTNAGVTGRTGPTQAQVNAAYSDSSLAGKVTINTQGIQEWTVPSTGTYTIEAWGASSGYDNASSNARIGKGARIQGEFTLQGGEIIKILAGQQGTINNTASSSGGGGGTYVIRSPFNTTNSILLIAGGGGAPENATGGVLSGQHGQTTTSGSSSLYGSTQSVGGSNGNGGGVNSGNSGGGGGGFISNGSNATTGGGGGRSFVNGGLGGSAQSNNIYGGFGGGGGAYGNGGGPGGGGGYSGGGGGDNSGNARGGGGGSYNSGANQDSTLGANVGHGKVTITFMGN